MRTPLWRLDAKRTFSPWRFFCGRQYCRGGCGAQPGRRYLRRRRAQGALRVLGRWMRMLTIPNQSSVAKAFQEFDEAGRMKPSPYYDRTVDVMEELVKFTLLTRDRTEYFTSRYSERRATSRKSGAGATRLSRRSRAREPEHMPGATL